MDRRILLVVIAVAFCLAFAVDVYRNGFLVVDQFLHAFRLEEIRPSP